MKQKGFDMNLRRYWRIAAVLIFLSALLLVVYTLWKQQYDEHYAFLNSQRYAFLWDAEENWKPQTCMGVVVLENSQMEHFSKQESLDMKDCFYLDDEPAAVDLATSTIYISKVGAATQKFTELDGILSLQKLGYELFFAPDAAFEDMPQAIENNHRFCLIATNGSERYSEYNVVFTTLPVMRLSLPDMDISSASKKDYDGELQLWDGTDDSSMITSSMKMHVRGATTSWVSDKKSWKVSLIDDGKKHNENLLGLGSDDDWILNAMLMDDTKIREKLSMDLWNQMQENDRTSGNMSTGAYVEVVANGSYRGLYLLQRRVDRKYLNLAGDYVLMKSKNTYTPENVYDAYELIDSSLPEEESYVLTEQFLSGDYEQVDVDSWLDLMLYVQLGYMADNRAQKNMYYLWERKNDQWSISFIPWDTDMSFGIGFDGFFVHRPEAYISGSCIRMEYSGLYLMYPDLIPRISQRWKELRQTVITEENLLQIIESAEWKVSSSGARMRNEELWGTRYENDTTDQVVWFLQNRLNYMDACYGYSAG